MKKFLLLLITIVFCCRAFAQDFAFGEYTQEELNMRKYAKDTAAPAVVLREFGKTFLSSADHIPLIHEYHVRIKVFSTKAFEEQGNISIPVHKSDNDRYEEVSQIEAITYYADENGLLQKSELDQKKIFHVKGSKYVDYVKFALPNLRKGCIIEYKYHLESPYRFNFRTWQFQTSIPKISSVYEAHLPAIYNYNVTLRGPYKLTNTKSELERECFSPGFGIKCDCSKITYIMNDIPAFMEESQMTSPHNFLAAIYFELSDYTDLSNGTTHKVTKEWKDIDYELKHADYFGSQMKRKDLFKDKLPFILAGKTTDLDKANAVYHYIQKNIRWNNYYGYGSDDGVKKALEQHSGSVADVNLALIAGLTAAGINTEAVLLSTRDNGVVNKLYPVVTDFDYVVAKVNIADKSYLLDATDPLLSFGLLPIRCLNDQGRVVSMDKPSYWIDLVASQRRSSTYALTLELLDNGKLKGTMTNYSIGYTAYERRKQIRKFNSVDEYVENMDEKMVGVKILKSEIVNLDSLDLPMSEKYEVEIDGTSSLDKGKANFSPFIFSKINENPFKLSERLYPVDWGVASDEKYIVNVRLPQGFGVENPPQNVAVSLPNQGGRFMTAFDNLQDGFTFSHIVQVNHAIYSPEEYPFLKELFNKIIQVEKTELVLKKK